MTHLFGTFAEYIREMLDIRRPLRGLERHAMLIRTMAWRGFVARYRASFGGLLWSVAHPVLLMALYTVVFSLFLKVRFATSASPYTFAVYLLCALLPWMAFSEGLMGATGVVRGNVNLVKRVVFPLEILPLNLVLSSVIQQLIGFVFLVPLAWFVTGQLHATVMVIPVIFALQLLFTIGLNWIVASIAVYLPDTGQIVEVGLRVFMFMTPIFYPRDVVPEKFDIIFQLNPIAHLVTLYRDAFMNGRLPDGWYLAAALVVCLFTFVFGYFWFMRSKKGFADVL